MRNRQQDEESNPVKSSWMVRIGVNARYKTGHSPKLLVIGTDVDVKMFHVKFGTFPPIFGVVRGIVKVADDGGLPVL